MTDRSGPDLNQTLSRTAEEVFESLAFVLPAFDPAEADAADPGETVTARIEFSGAFDGTLTLTASAALLPEISVNMLGLDFGEAPSPEVQQDAFAELLNVICGNLLPELAGREAVFDVAAAEVAGAPPAGESEPAAPVARARLALEGGWAELALFAPEGTLSPAGAT
jgi:CheY-specific phosphatase CheX